MENIIQEKIDKITPYLRGFRYSDDTLRPLISILIPIKWDYTHLVNHSVVVQHSIMNENAIGLIIGETSTEDEEGSDDKPIDYFFNLIEDTILINKEIERKELLLQEKINELKLFVQSQSIDAIEKLKIYKEDIQMLELNSESVEEENQLEEAVLKPFNIEEEIDSTNTKTPEYDVIELPQVIKDIQAYNKKNKK